MSIAPPSPVKNGSSRSILLVDIHRHTRESRAETMRKLGATVDSVSNADSAISQFGPGLYRLVLIDLGSNVAGAEQLARDIRLKNPNQMVGFFVGPPTFIATKILGQKAKHIPIRESSTEPLAKTDESEFGRRVKEAEQQALPSED